MAQVETNASVNGQIQIADEVIAIVAGTAALEIEGVAGMAGNLTGGLIEKLGRKNFAKGVIVNVTGNEVKIELHIVVRFGARIQDVSLDVQKRVKTAVETMTGLKATEINVVVTGLDMDRQKITKPEEPETD